MDRLVLYIHEKLETINHPSDFRELPFVAAILYIIFVVHTYRHEKL
jgi:hypothetical protein